MIAKKITKRLGSVFLRAWARAKTSVLTVVVALTLMTASTAMAATGGNFILGVANVATDPDGTGPATGITQLTANIANPAMKLINNNSTGTNATALHLQTDAKKPPMKVDSQTKVANLNADKIDNKSAEQLTRVANLRISAQTEIPTDGTQVTYGSPLSITAPASGFVRVNGNVTVRNVSCSSGCLSTGTVRHIQSLNHSNPAQEDVTSQKHGNISLDNVVPVSAGVNTFDVRLARDPAEPEISGIILGWWGHLTAEYTPYGSTGTGTLGTASAASASSPEEFDKMEQQKEQQVEAQQEQ